MAERRRRLLAFLDPLAFMWFEFTVGALVFAAGAIVGLTWGAAHLSALLFGDAVIDLNIGQAAAAAFRLGANRMGWDGVWSSEVQAALPGPVHFWAIFAMEVFVLALLFWPLWRLLAPRVPDPGVVGIVNLPDVHPAAAERERARKRRQERLQRASSGGGDLTLPPPVSPAGVERVLADRPGRGRLVLGRVGDKFVTTDRFQSVIMFGPRRTGKTSGILLPALAEWEGPVVISTSRPEVLAPVWHQRASREHISWLFDPGNSSTGFSLGVGAEPSLRQRPVHSSGWTPLSYVSNVRVGPNVPLEDQGRHQWSSARRVAQWMIAGAVHEATTTAESASRVMAEQILAPMLYAAAVHQRPVCDVAHWVESQDFETPSDLLERLNVDEVLAAWHGITSQSRSALIGGFQVLSIAMYPYGDPSVADLTSRAEIIVPRLFNGEPNTLLIGSLPNQQSRLKPLVSTLVAEIVDVAISRAMAAPSGALDPPLLVVLDDAVAFAPIALVEQLASIGPGLGIQLLTVFQNLSQVEKVSGSGRAAVQLADAHRTKLVLPGISDANTLGYLAPMLAGSRLVGAEPPPSQSELLTEKGEPDPLVATSTPSWLRTLDDGDAIAIHDNLPPMKIRLRSWYEDPELQARHGLDPDPRLSSRWGRLVRRLGSGDDGGVVVPGPLNSEANDREAQRYWEEVNRSGTLPQPRPYDDDTGHSRV